MTTTATSIRDLAEQCRRGTVDLERDVHPVHTRFADAEELDDGLLLFKGTAGANALDTGDGLVLLDTGGAPEADGLVAQVRRRRPAPPAPEAHRLRAEVYAARAAGQTSSMARNILDHTAASSRRGVRDLASSPYEVPASWEEALSTS